MRSNRKVQVPGTRINFQAPMEEWSPDLRVGVPKMGSPINEELRGEIVLRAVVEGPVKIDEGFLQTPKDDPSRFFLFVDSFVGEGIEFFSPRESLPGELTFWIQASVEGGVLLINRATGGKAEKRVHVRTPVRGRLTIELEEGANDSNWEMDIFGPNQEDVRVTSTNHRVGLKSVGIDSKGNRKVVIVGIPAKKRS